MREEVNILQNKELLVELLKQVDLLNSINGGIISADVNVISDVDKITIKVFAPTISVEAFSVMLNFSKLTVSIFPLNMFERNDSQNGFTPAFVPLFLRTFDIPSFVDMEKIKAVHEDNNLLLTLPFKSNSGNLLRMIDIIEI